MSNHPKKGERVIVKSLTAPLVPAQGRLRPVVKGDEYPGEVQSLDGSYVNVLLDAGYVVERYPNELEKV